MIPDRADLEQFLRKLAPGELADAPLYVVFADEVGGLSAGTCAGLTGSVLDVQFRDAIGPRWQGRGACMILNRELMQTLGERRYIDYPRDQTLTTAVHELAHILERPRPYYGETYGAADEAQILEDRVHTVESLNATLMVNRAIHGPKFQRIATHLAVRAERLGELLFTRQLLTGGYLPSEPYAGFKVIRSTLADELASMPCLDWVRESPVPDSFQRLFNLFRSDDYETLR